MIVHLAKRKLPSIRVTEANLGLGTIRNSASPLVRVLFGELDQVWSLSEPLPSVTSHLWPRVLSFLVANLIKEDGGGYAELPSPSTASCSVVSSCSETGCERRVKYHVFKGLVALLTI